jgi:hypothetical protein
MVAVRVAVMAAVSALAATVLDGGTRRRAASATVVPMPVVRTTSRAVVAVAVALTGRSPSGVRRPPAPSTSRTRRLPDQLGVSRSRTRPTRLLARSRATS